MERHGFLTQIDQKDADLASIIGVDGAGGIEDREAVSPCQAAARADLCLVALREGDGDPRCDQGAFERHEGAGRIFGHEKIHACGFFALVGGEAGGSLAEPLYWDQKGLLHRLALSSFLCWKIALQEEADPLYAWRAMDRGS